MDLKFLKENHTYLIRLSYSSDNVKSITVLIISDKAYKLRWNNDRNDRTEWVLRCSLDSDYSFVEDITDIVGNKLEEKDFKFDKTLLGLPNSLYYYNYNDEIKWHPHFFVEEPCKTCSGSGQVYNPLLTSCKKTCPICNGTGKQSKK